MPQTSPDLFDRVSRFPPGFRYQPELISDAEERRLLQELGKLNFKPFEFHGFTGKRLIVSFGWRYDFNSGGLQKTEDMPDFLLAVRKAAAEFANTDPSRLQQVLPTSIRRAQQSAGIKTVQSLGRSSGSLCCLRARSDLESRPDKSGSDVRSLQSQGLPICSTARPGPHGSTASRQLRPFATRSRCGICVKMTVKVPLGTACPTGR